MPQIVRRRLAADVVAVIRRRRLQLWRQPVNLSQAHVLASASALTAFRIWDAPDLACSEFLSREIGCMTYRRISVIKIRMIANGATAAKNARALTPPPR
jgi:hypothetical protein